ncbi:PKD_channel domain-containing protein [Haematococcus lacustris]|uniref:PKD_channel domain-containing protein n=1 Tax=Haematococcus lacustris TaxID=44745 RepID=A0A6A0A4H2_HAELA|nr:PKD_channel domain-containing protein [Haematococcus lacustris]
MVARRRLSAAASSNSAPASPSVVDWDGYKLLGDLLLLEYDLGQHQDISPPRYVGTEKHNKVLGGLMMHTLRTPVGLQHFQTGADVDCPSQQLVQGLGATCLARLAASSGLLDLGGFGTDPVFNPRSTLFNAALDVADWYNTSADSPDMSPQGSPFAFFHQPVPGMPVGYPLLVDTAISAKRAAQISSYLAEGGFLDRSFTESLDLRVRPLKLH